MQCVRFLIALDKYFDKRLYRRIARLVQALSEYIASKRGQALLYISFVLSTSSMSLLLYKRLAKLCCSDCI